MPFYMVHPSGKFDIEDLPLERWVTIEQEVGSKWHEILGSALIGDSKIATVVVREISAHLGIEAPKLTLRTLGKVLTFEEGENLPTQINDGIPDPKATDTDKGTT